MPSIYQKATGITYRKIADEAIIIPFSTARVGTAKLFRLTATADFLWQHLDGARTTNDLVNLLVAHFDVSAEQAAQDTDAFLSSMAAHGLVTPCQ
jgi:hypothetical protein